MPWISLVITESEPTTLEGAESVTQPVSSDDLDLQLLDFNKRVIRPLSKRLLALHQTPHAD